MGRRRRQQRLAKAPCVRIESRPHPTPTRLGTQKQRAVPAPATVGASSGPGGATSTEPVARARPGQWLPAVLPPPVTVSSADAVSHGEEGKAGQGGRDGGPGHGGGLTCGVVSEARQYSLGGASLTTSAPWADRRPWVAFDSAWLRGSLIYADCSNTRTQGARSSQVNMTRSQLIQGRLVLSSATCRPRARVLG